MCKYPSGHVSTTERSLGINKRSIVCGCECGRLLPAHPHRVGKFTENRDTPEHIRNSRRSPGGDRNKEKMFQQKLVIVIRTFLLFFLFQPSSLVATTRVEAGEYASRNELLFFAPLCFPRCTCLNLPVFIYLFSRCSRCRIRGSDSVLMPRVSQVQTTGGVAVAG